MQLVEIEQVVTH